MTPQLVRRLTPTGRWVVVGLMVFLPAALATCSMIFNGGMWGG